MFNASEIKKIAIVAAAICHHTPLESSILASFIIAPQLGLSVSPRPKKLSITSACIKPTKRREKLIITTWKRFGSRCLKIILPLPIPHDLAARTYWLSLRLIISPRTTSVLHLRSG